MQRHIRPLSVRRASADRDARLRQERDAALRAEAETLLDARGYTVTRCEFSPARGAYTIDFQATDDPDSRYVARDQDARLLTIRTYPPRRPFNVRQPQASRFLSTIAITMAFADSARTGFAALDGTKSSSAEVVANFTSAVNDLAKKLQPTDGAP